MMPAMKKRKPICNESFLILSTLLLFFLSYCIASAASRDSDDGILALSHQIIKGYKNTQKARRERVAVIGFTTLDGSACRISDLISAEMTNDLSEEKNFDLISRQDVKRIISENPKATHLDIGEILGATAVVTGIVMEMGNYEDINAWLIRCDESEKVLSSAKALINADAFQTNTEIGVSASQNGKSFQNWKWLENEGLSIQTETMSGPFNLPEKVLHNETGIVLVLVHPGRFLMGSPESNDSDVERLKDSRFSALKKGYKFEWEQPQHEVIISRPFYMGQFEVTNKQFRSLFSLHDSGTKHGKTLDSDEQPAVNLTLYEAESFCGEYGMRLPTEAEWEFCVRAGTDTRYFWGNNPDDGSGYCNVRDITYAGELNKNGQIFAFSDGYVVSAPVGSFKENAFGLHDMHGNVWEWCADGFHPDFYKDEKNPMDPFCPSEEFGPVLRGGSWAEGPARIRSAHRYWCEDNTSSFDRGFRVVLDIPIDSFIAEDRETSEVKGPDPSFKSEMKMPKTAVQVRLNKIAPLFEELGRLKAANDPQWKIINRNMFIELKYALYDYPYSPEVYYYYARAYYIHGNWKGATKFLRKTFYYDPHNVEALVFKGDMDYDFGKKSGMYVTSKLRLDMTAREAYEAAANLKEDKQFKAMIYLKIGNVYADLSKDKKKAKIYWQKCITTAPDSDAASQARQRMG